MAEQVPGRRPRIASAPEPRQGAMGVVQ